MNINRTNYESFVIDYLDGKLDAIAVSELLLFLEQHPDIAAEVDGLSESLPVIPDEIPMDFSGLKKPEYPEIRKSIEPLMVAQLEGDIRIPEYATLQDALKKYPELQQDIQQFRQTKIQPDFSITFPDKHKLKKPVIGFPVSFHTFSRIAAVLLLSAGFLWVAQQTGITTMEPSKPVAVVTPPVVATPKQQITGSITPASAEPSVGPVAAVITSVESKPATSVVPESNESVRFNETSQWVVLESKPVQLQLPEKELAVDLMPAQLQRTQTFAAVSILPATSEEFPTLSELARTKILETDSKKSNRELAVQAFNKLTGAGLAIDKDSTSGKINRFAITGLRLEWIAQK